MKPKIIDDEPGIKMDKQKFWLSHTAKTVMTFLLVAVVCVLSGSDFLKSHNQARLYPGPGVTGVTSLSAYLPNLKGTAGDSDVYIMDSGKPGETVVVLGGTHCDEPSGYIAAVTLVENVTVSSGRMIVVPQADRSGFTHTTPLEAYPGRFNIATKGGDRWFCFGSRLANPLDQWPDPDIMLHWPSGQKLSGDETRNLNRSYPGRPDGVFIERVAYAITTMVRNEHAALTIDLHEAPLEYFFIDALAVSDKAREIGVMAQLNLSFQDIEMGIEASPQNLRGLSHRELASATPTMTFLMETANPSQGRFRGRTTSDLVASGKDVCYETAARYKRLFVKYDDSGKPISLRVARHLTGVTEILNSYNELNPDKAISVDSIPSYESVLSEGIGSFLHSPEVN